MIKQKRSAYFNKSKSTWSFTIYTPTQQKESFVTAQKRLPPDTISVYVSVAFIVFDAIAI
jgi:hypothetical protein